MGLFVYASVCWYIWIDIMNSSQQTHYAIITSLLRQNDVILTWLRQSDVVWRCNDDIIMSYVQWVVAHPVSLTPVYEMMYHISSSLCPYHLKHCINHCACPCDISHSYFHSMICGFQGSVYACSVGHSTWWSLLGLLSWYPANLVTSLQLIWRYEIYGYPVFKRFAVTSLIDRVPV